MSDSTQNTEVLDLIEGFLSEYYHEEIGRLAQRYPNDQRSILIDWMDIYRFDVNLADDVRDKPDQMLEYFDEALRLYDLPVDVSLANASVRISNLPDSATYTVGSTREQQIGKYLGISGQVSKRTEVKPKPVELAFECQRCGTMTRIPQRGQEIQEPHECQGCERQGPFQARIQQSEFEDFQQVRIQQPPEETRGGQSSTIDVNVKGDMVNEVESGDRVTIAGTMDAEMPDGDAMTFEPYIKGRAAQQDNPGLDDLNIDEYKDEIEAIAAGEHGDPYELLVESLAPGIQNMRQIKLAIMLQLFGGTRVEYPDGSVDRGDSHILLLGDPGTAKSSLLKAAESIAPRSTYASGKGASAAGLTAAAVQDDFGEADWTLEAGALVLAHKGIACIDEIDKIDESASSSLHDAMESQLVQINKAGINTSLPARTSLLAAGNPEHGRFERNQPIAEQINLGPALLSRFDLMFMLDDQPEEEHDREIISGMIESRRIGAEYTDDPRAVDEDQLEQIQPAIERDTLRAYIARAKQLNPRIKDDEVASMLEDSYANLRMANGTDEDAPVPVTFRKLEGILRLAEASAKVRLSEEVTEADIRRAQELVGRSMRDVGMDPENSQLDADIVEAGTSKSQRDRMRSLEEIIAQLEQEHDKGAPLEKIVEAAQDADISRSRVVTDIEKFKRKGKIYENQTDYYRTT